MSQFSRTTARISSVRGRLSQRKCACGGTPGPSGECEECRRKRLGVGSLQAKLIVHQRGDPYEQEADEVAERVLRMPATGGQRKPLVQHRVTSEVGEADAPHIVHEVLRSTGQPLDAATRAFMEIRFGDGFSDSAAPPTQGNAWRHDFSHVRIHVDEPAAASARAVNAIAYTVGRDVVFGAGRHAPHTTEGRRLLAHELTHVVQQTHGVASDPVLGRSMALQRKVVLNGVEMSATARRAFLKGHRWPNASLAASVMEDMAAASDAFDFADEGELKTEVAKRLSTVRHMEESQETVERIPGDKRSAFGYPFNRASILYGPRVNYAAREYWEPAVPDNYAVRTDKVRNKELLRKPRYERCTVYGDPCGDYGWKLSAKGRTDPYHAVAYLFAPQPPQKRTLIHCDYLLSLVNFMALADAVGSTAFNKRIGAFGADRLFLKWNAFNDLHLATSERTATGEWAKTAGGAFVPKAGLGSTQRVRPSSEADFVIGDHVVFFNHLAYDLINKMIGNAWRLENAVLVTREKGKDVFLGHGSGHVTADTMRAKLAHEFNVVARQALDLVAKTKSPDKKAQAAGHSGLSANFPNVRQVGSEWRVQGVPELLSACPRHLDEKLRDDIKPTEVLGPKDPCDPTKMNEVERPIESAK